MGDKVIRDIRRRIELNEPLREVNIGQIVRGDANADRFVLELVENGQPVNLDDYSVSGFFINAISLDVPITGDITGNVLTATLGKGCYDVRGMAGGFIRVANGDASVIKTVLRFTTDVLSDGTGNIYDPDKVIGSVAELLAKISAMEKATADGLAAAEEARSAAAEADAAREAIQDDLGSLKDQTDVLKSNVYPNVLYEEIADENETESVTADHFFECQFEYGKTYALKLKLNDVNLRSNGIRVYTMRSKTSGSAHLVDTIGYYAGYSTGDTINITYTPSDGNAKWLFIRVYEGIGVTNIALTVNAVINVGDLAKANETKINGWHRSPHSVVKSIAHRGANEIAPENTAAAFRLARKQGFVYVEADVRFTSDNIPVIIHDETVDRTSNGSGNVKDMTLAELQALDFGSWKSDMYAGERIMTFDAFMLLCRNLGLYPYVELKILTADMTAQAQALVDICAKYNMADKVTWITSDWARAKRIANLLVKCRLGYLHAPDDTTCSGLADYKTEDRDVFIIPTGKTVDEYNSYVSVCQQHGIALEVGNIDTQTDFALLDGYITGFISNKYIAEKELYDLSVN